MMPEGMTGETEEGNGFRIWVDTPGYVPNIIVYRRANRLSDPDNYIKNVVPESMKERYGDKLAAVSVLEYYETGGKKLLCCSFVYKDSVGNAVTLLHLVELRSDGDVEYQCRYVDTGDEKKTTLNALDAAVRYYKPDNEAQGPGRESSSAESSAASHPGPGTGKTFSATKAQPIVSGTAVYEDGRFTVTLPKGWQIMTQSDFMYFCYRAYDPNDPNRAFFMYMKLEPFLKSQAAKAAYKQADSLSADDLYKLFGEAPVLEPLSLEAFLGTIPGIRYYAGLFYTQGLTMNPEVFPVMNNVTVLEKKPSPLPAPDTCPDNSIGRITFDGYEGAACEGLVTAQPTSNGSYYMFGVDAAPLTVYLFTGFTAPVGEMPELEPILTECLGSFEFNEQYVKTAIDLSRAETEALLEQARIMQATHDAMVDAWYAREQRYDIISQKQSDATLGYDRLYDSVTGEIYRADMSFYDNYNLHRDEYSNPNLQKIDSGTEEYYLRGVDYYIE